jgi:hypothetical protein
MPGGATPLPPAVTLFRSILRLHRSSLPPASRHLGDAYVKHEFRAHATAEPKHVAPFLAAWGEYREHLISGKVQQAIDTENMSEEQKESLKQLRSEVRKQKEAKSTHQTSSSAS